MPRTLGIRATCLFAAALLAGCAQPPARVAGTEKVPAFVPTDYWRASPEKNAGVASASRDAVFLIACTDDHPPTITLLVDPMAMPSIPAGAREVTITLDNEAPFTQTWLAGSGGYGISSDRQDFAADIEKLKAHHRVEFALIDDGKELDRHSFTLNGAAQAFDTVLADCAK